MFCNKLFTFDGLGGKVRLGEMLLKEATILAMTLLGAFLNIMFPFKVETHLSCPGKG